MPGASRFTRGGTTQRVDGSLTKVAGHRCQHAEAQDRP
jgi:hypothetical protein